MEIIDTKLDDVKLLKPKIFGDERGFFMETFRQDIFQQACAPLKFVQDNHSKSHKGILRGLHYQTIQPQGKLVRVVSGAVFDVAVDMRESSATCGEWYGTELSAENGHQLWVPPGFAHGFLVLSEFAEFVYKCTDYYHPESEVSVRFDDPEIGIDWPKLSSNKIVLSSKDQNGVSFNNAHKFKNS